MDKSQDPFAPLQEAETGVVAGGPADDFSILTARTASTEQATLPTAPGSAPVLAQLHGFDLQEQPLLSQLPGSPGQIVSARTTAPLRRSMIGSQVLVVFIAGDPTQPIITGVLQTPSVAVAAAAPGVVVQADGERHLISAEREIVLRCGDASITLTRAGKVIIKGNYILSRSTGYNKIKGAAIDLN